MSLPQEYLDELNTLNKEVLAKQPKDVLEFCANYFNSRLEQKKQQQLKPGPRQRSQTESIDPASIPEEPHEANSGIGGHFSAFKTKLFSHEGSVDPASTASPTSASITPNSTGNSAASGSLFSSSFGGSLRSAATSAAGRFNGHFPINFNANRRTSVSAESLNPTSFSGASFEPNNKKHLTPAQLERLNKSVGQNFLFANLDEESRKSVLSALEEKKVPAGTVVIKQGDEGDFFYIVESGSLDFTVNGENVGSAEPGSSFGELALMYNSPRAATVTAKTESVLWALDRLTFRRILLDKTSAKRKLYGNFLKEVPILRGLDSYAISKLADALSTEVYEPNQVIIKEGDVGEQFYIIEDGEAEVTKKSEGVVQTLTKGSYFGEIALINDLPRQATVTSKTKLCLVTLDKSAFKRLLGDVIDTLKKHAPTN
ncbi:hypothetical protein DV113_002780 [Geotrichum candidum]|uniref:cAMP-dependent protein kinase regulatory subunit n=1 Tax=Geotrichum candidum TaxID=1173061 RepID=A0A0J9X6F6_GEOCN|nr:hypothetical protein DV452_002665 [Geotrichum candidum]KAF7499216.1 hypothetical protein DV113_002780 [Geotrichum candidum]KAI8133905.1 hypothetical protein DUD61_002409 [Geotrichum candidum]CDO52699.1 similar to Saccharomyces cerevisiae YIL033C BCY1 Regulatory subunit of the cyclic AMP-dependent protein kinase (PKA) [Geotrichum candidum]